MPIYEYQAKSQEAACDYCRNGFEIIQKIADEKLNLCPKCGTPIDRLISAPALGHSESCLDDRAKAAGFTKLKRLGKGEYEKQY